MSFFINDPFCGILYGNTKQTETMDANIRRSGLLGAIFQAGTIVAQLVNCITKIHTNFSLTLEAILLTTFAINNKGKIL